MRLSDLEPPWFDIVYEDDALLVVNKRAGVATMGVDATTPELLSGVRTYLKLGQEDPFIGILGRLDFPVSGILVVAKCSDVASQLVKQRDAGRMSKRYHAVVTGWLPRDSDTLTHSLLKSKRHRRVSIVPDGTDDAQTAQLKYDVIGTGPDTSLLQIELLTGRKHQIRAQFGHLGHPVLGDRKYGSKCEFPAGIALILKRLELTHPRREQRQSWEVSYPTAWAVTLADVESPSDHERGG